MQPQVISGARTVVKFNNQTVAAGYVLDYRIETLVTEISGIDNVLSEELAPERINVSATLRVYRTPDNDPVTAGYAPAGEGSTAQEYARSGYISVEVRDRESDMTVIYIPRARIVSRSGSVASEDLLTETWAIKGIGYMGPGQQEGSVFGVVSALFK